MLGLDLEIIKKRVRKESINKVETSDHSDADQFLAIKWRA